MGERKTYDLGSLRRAAGESEFRDDNVPLRELRVGGLDVRLELGKAGAIPVLIWKRTSEYQYHCGSEAKISSGCNGPPEIKPRLA